MSGQQSPTYPKTLYTSSGLLPLTIRLISFSLFNASSGVKLFTSRFSISSRIWHSIGSSSWKKLSCIPPRVSPTSAIGLLVIPLLAVVCFKLFQNVIGTFHDAFGHTRHFGYMNTEGVFAATAFQFAQENDFIIYLLHRNVIVLDALEAFLHLVQLMVVRGKQAYVPWPEDVRGYAPQWPMQWKYRRKWKYRAPTHRTAPDCGRRGCSRCPPPRSSPP